MTPHMWPAFDIADAIGLLRISASRAQAGAS
jgi:hypothetical protein